MSSPQVPPTPGGDPSPRDSTFQAVEAEGVGEGSENFQVGAPDLTSKDTEWWLDRLNAMHSLACDSDALPVFRSEPWRKLSAYDISRMADLLAEAEHRV